MLSVNSKILIAASVLITFVFFYFFIFTKLILFSIGILVFSVLLFFMTFFSIEADYLKRESMRYNLSEKLWLIYIFNEAMQLALSKPQGKL